VARGIPKNKANLVDKSCETVSVMTPIKKVIIKSFCQARALAELRFFKSHSENTIVETTKIILINIFPHLKNRSLRIFTLFQSD